jgi:hypothetical protein
MADRIVRAINFGIVGAVVGFYVVGLVTQGICWMQDGYDPSIGGAVQLIATLIGCPLGFTFGAILGFRKRRSKESQPAN